MEKKIDVQHQIDFDGVFHLELAFIYHFILSQISL